LPTLNPNRQENIGIEKAERNKASCQHRIKIIGQLVLNSMAWAFLRSRQIFKFGLLRKKIIRKI